MLLQLFGRNPHAYQHCASAAYYDWCVVPNSGYDSILFAGVALVAACLLQGKFASLYVMAAGRIPAHAIGAMAESIPDIIALIAHHIRFVKQVMQEHWHLGQRVSHTGQFRCATGAALQTIAFPLNMGRFGNSLAIWLGIRPADLLLYTFLPPMLLDAAMRIDFFLFSKVP